MVGSLKKHFQTRFCPANIFLSLMFTNAHGSHQLLTSEIKIKLQTRRLLLQSIVRPRKKNVELSTKSSDFLFRYTCAWYLLLPRLFFARIFCPRFFFQNTLKRKIKHIISDFFSINLFWI